MSGAQFQHARIKNAKLVSFEPYELFRHDVLKAVEPEATWQPTGVPAPEKVRGTKTKRFVVQSLSVRVISCWGTCSVVRNPRRVG